MTEAGLEGVYFEAMHFGKWERAVATKDNCSDCPKTSPSVSEEQRRGVVL